MTARQARTGRLRRERREARERAWREWVCGGPLVDVAAPVIGGDGGVEHMRILALALEERSRKMQRESKLLLAAFARECWVVKAEEREMYARMLILLFYVGPPNSVPTSSTFVGTGLPEIPRLP